MQSVSQTMVTEESLTCQISVKDAIRIGRDGHSCSFVLNDTRVSRKQLSIQAYRKTGRPELRFTVQNISQKGKILVNGHELSHLERTDLEEKSLLRFGKYELMIWWEPGEAQDCFEVLFEKLNLSPSREMGIDLPCRMAVIDTGMINYQNVEPVSQEPLESDETLSM